MKITLQPGDRFYVHNKGCVPDLINIFQAFKSKDKKSEFSHSGLIIDWNGQSAESRKKINMYHINDFVGCPIMIVRDNKMTPEKFIEGWAYVRKHLGKTYPVLRLGLFAIGMADKIHWEHPVCSEFVSKFDVGAWLRHEWWGLSPDNLADEARDNPTRYQILFKGIWESNLID